MSESGRGHLWQWQCLRSCSEQQGSQRVREETHQPIYTNGRYRIRPLIYGTYDIQQQKGLVFFQRQGSALCFGTFRHQEKAIRYRKQSQRVVHHRPWNRQAGNNGRKGRTGIAVFGRGLTRPNSYCIPSRTTGGNWKNQEAIQEK